MTIQKSFFWDGEQEYGQEELQQVLNSFMTSGVAVQDNGTLDFKVTAGTGKVDIAPGRALCNGVWRYEPEAISLTIAKPTAYSRIDRVVVRGDFTKRVTEIAIKQGAEASSPQPPALQRDADKYEISLAQVLCTPAGAITVTDERADNTVCGAIRARGMSEFDTYFENIKFAFKQWFEQQQGTGWRNVFIQDGEPTDPTSGSVFVQTGADRDTPYYYDETGQKKELFIGDQIRTKYFQTGFITIPKNGWNTVAQNIEIPGWRPLGFLQLETFNYDGSGHLESWCNVYRQYLEGNPPNTARFYIHNGFGSQARIKVTYLILYVRKKG
jgi:hypothetical protein